MTTNRKGPGRHHKERHRTTSPKAAVIRDVDAACIVLILPAIT